MVTSCPAWTVQVMRSGDDEAQKTDDSSSGVAPIGDGGAPNTDPDLIMGVSIVGASRLALSSRLWSPGSTAKSAQTLVICQPGPRLACTAHDADLLFGKRRAFIHLYRALTQGTAGTEEPHHGERHTAMFPC